MNMDTNVAEANDIWITEQQHNGENYEDQNH